jgi:glycerol 3-phosphatase-2
VSVTPLLASYDHVLLDLDGCVWVGEEATPGAAEAVAALRAAGKGIAFVTNSALQAGEDFVRRLWRLGVQASLDEVVTVGGALQHHLADRHQGASATVIGSAAVHRHVADAGLRIVNHTTFAGRADVVVVAGHERFDYAELRAAVQAATRGAVLVGADRDATYPMQDGPWPGSGAIIAAVEYACGRQVLTLGKPGPGLVLTALDRLGPGRALMIGDRADVDLGAAHAAGIDGALVLTGAGDAAAARAAPEPGPVAVAPDLRTLVLGAA